MPIGIPLLIEGINMTGVGSNFINFIQGSKLDHQRYLAIWVKNGYDIKNPDFLRWLFGVQGNNTQRAGALTVDMLNGHELILMESAPWKTIIGLGMGVGAGVNFMNPPVNAAASPLVLGPLAWAIILAIVGFYMKK